MCFKLTEPILGPLGDPEPLGILAVCFNRYVTGGERKLKENVRSGFMVIKVGVGRDGARCAVRALLLYVSRLSKERVTLEERRNGEEGGGGRVKGEG